MTLENSSSGYIKGTLSTLERRMVEGLGENFKDTIGEILINEVPGGLVLQLENHKPTLGDWLLLDLDDVVVAYSAAKAVRQTLFGEFLSQSGLNLTTEQSQRLMDITDRFSRWSINDASPNQYHLNAHKLSLQWAVDQLKTPAESIDESINKIEDNLKTINQGQNVADVPFYIRDKDKRFVSINSANNKWSQELDDVFVKSMIQPGRYGEILQALQQISSNTDINIGIFTYGNPYFQSRKVLELLKEYPELPISQVWLTQKPKGDFLKEVMKSGHSLGNSVTVIDDSPAELDSLIKLNQSEETKLSVVAIRSIRPGTRDGEKPWKYETDGNTMNFNKQYQSNEISRVVLTNRYLMLKSKYGDQDKRVINACRDLEKVA